MRTNDATFVSGLPPTPVNSVSRGRTTGSCSKGTGTVPHRSQYTIGMGVPQYRCREMSQSRSRYVTEGPPMPRRFASSATAFFPEALERPVNGPLRTMVPSPTYAASSPACSRPSGEMTSRISRP